MYQEKKIAVKLFIKMIELAHVTQSSAPFESKFDQGNKFDGCSPERLESIQCSDDRMNIVVNVEFAFKIAFPIASLTDRMPMYLETDLPICSLFLGNFPARLDPRNVTCIVGPIFL